MADLEVLRRDLSLEHSGLDEIVAELEQGDWDRDTPAVGWSIRDQISHLGFFDRQATLAMADPDGFAAGLQEAAADPVAFMEGPLEAGRRLPVGEVLASWRAARAEMLAASRSLGGGERVPWFGPPMSPASFITARLMETWAHGQDVFDTLRVPREPTERLRHIAFLGYRARSFSYTTNGKTPPDSDVRVELSAPDGNTWAFGDSETDLVTGPALDFCLLVTQRRHRADTAIVARGELADEWLSIAQCFAGPPGAGRTPGQFMF